MLNSRLNYVYHVRIRDIWALGISVVIAGSNFLYLQQYILYWFHFSLGQYSGWNSGFHAGFGSYSITYLLSGAAYLILVFSIGEMTSALPFAGGAWGNL